MNHVMSENIDDGKHESSVMKILDRAGRCQSLFFVSAANETDTLPKNGSVSQQSHQIRVVKYWLQSNTGITVTKMLLITEPVA